MPELESAGSTPLAAGAVLILFAVAFGLGGWIVRPDVTRYWQWSDVTLLRLTVGLNLLGVVGIVVGMTGALSQGRSVWLLIGLGLLCIWSEKGRWNYGKPQIRSGGADSRIIRPGRVGSSAMFLAGLAAIITAATLGPALCYPTGWDELVYHGVLPQRWLAAGWPAFYPDLPYSGFPSFAETLFWLAAPIENVIAPRLLVWTCWIVGLICALRLLRRHLGIATATVLTLAFAVSDTVLMISANCYVESILLMDVAALLLALKLRGWRRTAHSNLAQATVVGILAGGAAAVKLTGCAVLAVPVIWYAVRFCFGRSVSRTALHGGDSDAHTRWRVVIGPLAVYGLVALGVCLPFYVRPWLATGNPFYPYFCHWFTEETARVEMSRYHHVIGGFKFGVSSLPAFAVAPLLLAFRVENYDGEFGWQLLLFIALAIFSVVSALRRLRPFVLSLCCVAVWFYVFWFLTAQQARFAISFVMVLMLMAGIGLRLLAQQWRRFALFTLLAATLVSIPWRRTDYYRASWLTVAGRLSRTDYVHNLTDRVHLPLIQAVHALTPDDAKLLLLFEHRGFYLSRHFQIGTPLFQEGPFSPPEQFADMASVLGVLQREQITHVVAAKSNPGPDQAPGWIERQQPLLRAIERCVAQRRLVTRWESEEYVLLEVAK